MPSKRKRNGKQKAPPANPAEKTPHLSPEEKKQPTDEIMAPSDKTPNSDVGAPHPNKTREAKPSEGNQPEHVAPFANLRGIGEALSDDEDGDGDATMETLAISDIPTDTLTEARNDQPAIERKLAEIALFAPIGDAKPRLPFRDSLAVTMPGAPLRAKLAIEDFEREKEIAARTTAAVHIGLTRLRQQGVKFRRPDDYFAQMVKTDAQMEKVKKKIIHEKTKIEAAETRRNNRDIAKNRKKVRHEQLEKEQEKKRKAKDEIEAVSRVRKQRLWDRAQKADTEHGGDNSDNDGGDEFPIEVLDVEQLDEDSVFQSQGDIASGKKKPWRAPKKDNSGGDSRGDRKNPRGKKASTSRGNQRRGNPKFNGGVKKKGQKKRLGRSRRIAKKQ